MPILKRSCVIPSSVFSGFKNKVKFSSGGGLGGTIFPFQLASINTYERYKTFDLLGFADKLCGMWFVQKWLFCKMS